jgi:CRISPR system Cascade subunit CasB
MQLHEDLGSYVANMAAVLSHSEFPSGQRAALRRMAPGQPPPLEFYRFALRHLPEKWVAQEEDWKTLVAGMALMAPHIHRPERSFGGALAEANFSEARLERLLAAEDQTRRLLFLRAIRFLVRDGLAFNWLEAARFLLTKDEEKREEICRRIASDFYRTSEGQQKKAS